MSKIEITEDLLLKSSVPQSTPFFDNFQVEKIDEPEIFRISKLHEHCFFSGLL